MKGSNRNETMFRLSSSVFFMRSSIQKFSTGRFLSIGQSTSGLLGNTEESSPLSNQCFGTLEALPYKFL